MGDQIDMARTKLLGRRSRTFLLFGCAAAAVLAFGWSPLDAQSAADYPDLVSDPVENAQPPAEITWKGEDLLVVTFDGFVTNLGGGALHVEGNPQSDASTSERVAQHILSSSGSTLARYPLAVTGSNPAVQFENSDDHNHWHLMRIMEYSLWTEDLSEQVTAGQKIGFCLYDIERVSGSEPGVYNGGGNWCAGAGYPGGGPDATYLEMGVSSGWRDTYNRFISLQWVDVSDVAPGRYRLGALSDPNGVVVEADETNNGYAWTGTVTVVPGHKATNVNAGTISGARTIQLASTTFGSAGSRAFVIESAPAHGTLNAAVGEVVAGDSVVYTPDATYSGPDSFTFSAFDTTSAYPRNPDPAAITATVSMTVAEAGPNNPPVIVDPADQSSNERDTVSLAITASDPDFDTLTFSATNLPKGLAIDGATGVISGKLNNKSSGSYTVTVTVTDPGGLADATSFAWTVAESGGGGSGGGGNGGGNGGGPGGCQGRGCR
jgi:hypothetical protein